MSLLRNSVDTDGGQQSLHGSWQFKGEAAGALQLRGIHNTRERPRVISINQKSIYTRYIST